MVEVYLGAACQVAATAQPFARPAPLLASPFRARRALARIFAPVESFHHCRRPDVILRRWLGLIFMARVGPRQLCRAYI